MGISSISSYRGSQLFEIVGLNNDVIDLCFTNSISRIAGKNFDDLDNENKKLSEYAKSNLSDISVGGLLKYVHGGEYHTYNPEIVKKLQEAVSTGLDQKYQEYADLVDKRPPAMLRDILGIKKSKKSIDIKKDKKTVGKK